MRRATSLLIAVVAVCALAACRYSGTSAEDVLWPELTGPYVQATEDWTRTGVVYDGVNLEFSVTATAKSLPWREAFAARSAEVYSLRRAEQDKGLAGQKAAHATGSDFVLALESPRFGNEKLSVKSERWKVFAFQGENKLYPLEIKAMGRKYWPNTKLKAFFPYHTRWQTFYAVHFERLAPGPVKLTVSGPAGIVTMDWERFE